MSMTREQFEEQFATICQANGVKLFLRDPHVGSNNGYAQANEVHLGRKYKNNHIYFAVAFHEFGHAIINIKRDRGVKRYALTSSFHEEQFAWTLGMKFYAKYFGKCFTKSMGDFMLMCLKTHSRTHYSFKNIFNDEIS